MACPIVTVTIGDVEIIRTDGITTRMIVTTHQDQIAVAEALSGAIATFLAGQPKLSDLAIAADAVEKMAHSSDAELYNSGCAKIIHCISAFRDRVLSSAHRGKPH